MCVMRRGDYIYGSLIGEGGHARCFRATRDLEGVAEEVVLKIARLGHRRRLTAEVAALARLSHPHVPRVLERTLEELVLPHIDGSDLQSIVDDMSKLPAVDVASIGADIAGAVAHAHSRSVMHGDISPTNIMIDSTGWCWLIDWGCSRHPPDHTTASRVAGKWQFLAPESRAGKGRYASDVYALGAVLRALVDEDDDQGSELHALIAKMTASSPGLRPSAELAMVGLESLRDGSRRSQLGQWARECQRAVGVDCGDDTRPMRAAV